MEGVNLEEVNKIASMFKEMPDGAHINELYNKMTAEEYDHFIKGIKFTEPMEIAKQVGEIAQNDCKLLDIGAGSGIIGEQIQQYGVSDVHGVDASEMFVEALNKRGVYKSARAIFLGMGKFPEA